MNTDCFFDLLQRPCNSSIKQYLDKARIRFTENQIPFHYIKDFTSLKMLKKELIQNDKTVYYGNVDESGLPHGIG